MAMGTIVTQFVFPLLLCSTVATFSTLLPNPPCRLKNFMGEKQKRFSQAYDEKRNRFIVL
jgi:hypothetical protein